VKIKEKAACHTASAGRVSSRGITGSDYISSPLELVVCYVRLLQKMTEAELYTVHKGVYVPTHLHPPESLKYCEEFTFRPDDILIVTYPKSGEFAEFYFLLLH